jgi:hypothetical protein
MEIDKQLALGNAILKITRSGSGTDTTYGIEPV